MKQPQPHSAETEKAVLACVLLNPSALSTVAAKVTQDDFYLETNKVIYAAMKELADRDVPIDLRTLQAEVELRSDVVNLAHLTELDMLLPDASRLLHYLDVLIERSARRQILGTWNAAVAAVNSDSPAHVVVGQLSAKVMAVASMLDRDNNRGFLPARAIIPEVVEFFADENPGLQTGFAGFDRVTGGLGPGNLIIVAGRTAMGKTAFAMNVAQQVSLRGASVGVFSLEMTRRELLARMVASTAYVSTQDIKSGNLTDDQAEAVRHAFHQLESAPLYIDDTADTLEGIVAQSRSLQAAHGLDLMIIDYLQLMKIMGKFENRQLEVATISRGLKLLAKRLGIPIIALSQLSRRPDQRSGDHRPQLGDLRESGAIEQDADVVVFVYRPEVYDPSPDLVGRGELIVAKNRHGAAETIEMYFSGRATCWRDLYRQEWSGDASF